MSSFSLDSDDLENIAAAIHEIKVMTETTGVIIDTPTPLWIEGELVGYLTMENGKYGFVGSLT